ncbi:MAG: hypothetical protein RL347_189 [Actinomycetota bacterium]|jgi:hypothetical protein
MDLRTWLAGAAFAIALIAGLILGWWQGPSLAPDAAGPPLSEVAASSAVAITGDVAQPLESAGSGDRGVSSSSPSPAPSPYDGPVFAIGDSVLAGAAACLARRGIDVDAKQSRRASDALAILERKADRLPARVIVHLGTNGGLTEGEADAVMEILGPDRVVMWSTIQLPDDPTRYTYEQATNEVIAALPQRYSNVRIFDWESMTRQQPEWLYAEGIHMTPEGCAGYASLVEPQLRAP